MWIWHWLIENKDGIQLIASLLFGLMSLSVACIALWVAYRNNFGWKPLVLLMSYGIGGGGALGNVVTCSFEIWNRRKYPVVLREMQVSWGDTRIVSEGGFTNEEWCPARNGNMLFCTSRLIKPGESEKEIVSGLLIGDQRASIGGRSSAPVEIWAHVFDPKNNSHYVIYANSRERWVLVDGFIRLWGRQMPRY